MSCSNPFTPFSFSLAAIPLIGVSVLIEIKAEDIYFSSKEIDESPDE
jgi:hypothetical protein